MPEWREEIRRRLEHLRMEAASEAQIVEEMSQHLEDRYRELRSRGELEAAARQAALAELDEMDLLERQLASERGRAAASEITLGRARASRLDSLMHDVRYALRSLRSSPGYTTASALTLALGIGACTLIFSVANGIVLKPLPFKEPDRLVHIMGTAPEKGLPEVAHTQELYAVYRQRTRTMESVAIYDGGGMNLTGVGEPRRLEGAAASLDFFRVLGVQPLLGRTFVAGEDVRNDVVTVLSHASWQNVFGGRPDIVGQTITLDGRARTVVGVMPPGFDYPNKAQLWVPMRVDASESGCWCYFPLGRMRPGVTPQDVAREIATITDDHWISRDPNAKRGDARIIALRLSDRMVGNLQKPLVVLLAATGLVLLIACANIANLSLARASARAREIAVRCCLGASARRIATQFLTESVVLSVLGAAAGLALAVWGVQAVRRLPDGVFPRLEEVRLDGTVLAFTAGISILTGLLCGIVPALRASRVDLQDAVKSGARVAGRGSRVSDLFVVVQFALSLVLLAGAGLLLRSYQQLLRVDLGYRPQNVLTARLELPYPRYDSTTKVRAFYDRLVDGVREIPGVRAVGIASRIPLTGGNPQSNVVAEGKEPKPGEAVRVANVRMVTPDYFAAMGTPLVRGRLFIAEDGLRGEPVTVVDEALAKHFWPGEDAVGKRVRYQGDSSATRWMRVVGIVRNVKHNSLDEATDLQLYEPFARRVHWGPYVVIRSTLSPEALTTQLRRAVAAQDPTLPLFAVRTMQTALDNSLSAKRLTNALLGGFAIVALVLAAIGIYGVMAIGVNGRMREFGIRLALGAQAANVRGLVLRHGLTIAAIGVGIGLVGALATTRFLRSLLFGVEPADWVTFGAVTVVLTSAAVVASYLPARRATRSDPIVVLRAE